MIFIIFWGGGGGGGGASVISHVFNRGVNLFMIVTVPGHCLFLLFFSSFSHFYCKDFFSFQFQDACNNIWYLKMFGKYDFHIVLTNFC